MTFEIWSLYVMTVFIILCTPGPSHLLMLSHSISYGFHRSIFTAIGDLSANICQILIVGLGLATFITHSLYSLTIIKWVGGLYLIWLGLNKIIQAHKNTNINRAVKQKISPTILWWHGFMTSMVNPKAIIFFAALLPQFILPQASSFQSQLFILTLSYIFIDGAFLCVYGIGASYITQYLHMKARVRLEKIGGILMILAALLLVMKTVSEY